MKSTLLRGAKGLASRFLIALVLLQNFAFVIPVASAAEQASYRWRNDDGNETTATWKAAENTATSLTRGETERLRFAVSHDGSDKDVTQSIRLNSGDDSYYSEVLDPTTNFLYVGTATSPARIIKYQTSPTFSYVDEIALPSGENNLFAAAIDSTNGFAYFVTSTVPSKVVKVDLSTFTVASTLTLASGDDYIGSATLYAGYLYLLTRGDPGAIVKVDVTNGTSFSRISTVSLPFENTLFTFGGNNLGANDDKLYLAYGQNYVMRFDISSPGSNDPSFVDSLTIPLAIDLNANYTYAQGITIDTTNDKLYTTNYYGRIHKIDIAGGATFTYDTYVDVSLSGAYGANAIDISGGKLYIGGYNSGAVAKIDLTSYTQETYTTSLTYALITQLVLNPSGTKLFAPSIYAPGHIQQIATSDLSGTTVASGATHGDDYINVGVIDTSANIGYYATGSIGANSIIKVDLATMTRLDRIDLPSNYDVMYAGAIDIPDGYAYFVDYTYPDTHVIRVKLSDFTYTTLTITSTYPTLYDYRYDTMSIDTNPSHHYLYMATYNIPGVVTQVDLNTFTQGSSISTGATEGRYEYASSIDTVNNKLYVPSYTGKVVRLNVAGSGLSVDGTFNLGAGNDYPTASMIDEAGGILYVAGGGSHVSKVNVANGTTFSVIDSLYVGGSDDYIINGDIDLATGYAYFGGAGTPGKVYRVELSPFSYDIADDIIAPDSAEFVYGVNVDSAAGYLYYATYESPALLAKVSIQDKRPLRLEYAPKNVTCAASTYTAVANGNDWVPSLSPNVVGGTATTNVGPGDLTDPAGTFKPGYFASSSGQTAGVRLNANRFTEVEYAFKAAPSAAAGDYCFRLTDAGSPTDFAFTNYAEASLTTNDTTLSNAAIMTNMTAGATSTVTIAFTLQNDFPSGTLTVTFPAGFTSITAPTASLGTCTLDTFGAAGQTMTAEKHGCVAGDTVILTGGTVVNPAAGVYTISWTNDDPGYAIVAIVDSDQVTVDATVSPSITFDIDTNTTGADTPAPYSVALGALTLGAVNHSDNSTVNSIYAQLDTNATSGGIVTVLSANAALKSAAVPSDTIPNAAGTMAAGTANYGLCVNTVTAPSASSGTFQPSAPYNAGTCDPTGSANAVKTLSTVTPTSILDSGTNAVTAGTAEILVNAAISATTAAHSDYTDTLTFVATGTF